MKIIKHLVIIGLLCGALLIPSSAYSWGVVGLGTGAGGGGACSGTYGNSATTDSGYTGGVAGRVFARNVTLACSGTPTSINYRDKYTNGSVVFVVYSTDGTRLWYSSSPVSIGAPSSTTTISDTSINYNFSAGTYRIGVVPSASNRIYHSGTGSSNVFYSTSTENYPTPNASFGESVTTPTYTDEIEVWLVFE